MASAQKQEKTELFDDVKPRGDARVVRFSVRLSRDEWRALLTRARADSRSAANYVRALIRKDQKK